MSAPLRAAVVGVGYLGRFHAQKYKTLSGVELVAVCDASREQADKVAAELGVRALTNPTELIGAVDMVTVAASTRAHYELGKQFLSAGIPTNLEKPLAATSAQAKELVELAAQKKTLLCTGHIERFNPAIRELKNNFKSPSFFDLIRHTPFRERGADVSVIHDLMIHDIDLLLWFTGSRVRSVRASGHALKTKTWDSVEAFIELENGQTARLSASRVSSRPQRSIRVFDQGQVLFADTGTLELDVVDGDKASDPRKKTCDKADALQAETEAFVAAVAGLAQPVVTGLDGLRALEVVDQIEAVLGSPT